MGRTRDKRWRAWTGGVVFLGGWALLHGTAATHPVGALPLAPWNAAPVLGFALVWHVGPAGVVPAATVAAISGLFGGGALGGAVLVIQALAWAGAAAALRGADFDARLTRLRDTATLLGAVAAAAMLAAFAAALTAMIAGESAATARTLLARLFFGQAAAGTAVAPLLLLVLTRGREPWRGWPSGETVLQVICLLLLSWEVFGQFANEEIRFFYLLFLPFAWIAARHGVTGAAAGLAATWGALVVSDLMLVHKDAAVVELQIRMLALGVISLLFGAVVGERRAAEDKLAARQRELAHVLRLNIGSEMASALAHELNQPLTAAMSYCEAGLKLLRAEAPQAAKAPVAFGKALDQIEQAGDIIRRLREFMRKGDIQLATVALGEIVDDALRLAAAEIASSGVAVRAQLPPELPAVLVDKTQVVQVLLNLVRNAMQAIESTGAPSGAITIAARPEAGMVEVSVTDTGPGLPAGIAARLFEPFVTTKAAGMGLGLSISKSIVEAHGGRLWAEPAAHGASFRFTLPRAKQGNDDAA